MKVYENEDEAVRDALNLSKAMSYKSALAGLPYGGAKAVIMLKPGIEYKRHDILQAYAERVDSLGGLFRTGTDVGMTDADTTFMSKYCKYILGVKQLGNSELTTAKSAALGVYYAIKAAAKFKYGSEDLSGKTIGVKGIGKLGYELVRLLSNDGALITVADINKESIDSIISELPGIKVVDSAVIHRQKLDIYAPCALGNEFNKKTISELNCQIVAGGANNQLENLEAGDKLFDSGILYVPDYIANAGGLIFVSDELEPGGFKEERILNRLKNIESTLEKVFSRSVKNKEPTHRVSDKIAQERIFRKSTI